MFLYLTWGPEVRVHFALEIVWSLDIPTAFQELSSDQGQNV